MSNVLLFGKKVNFQVLQLGLYSSSKEEIISKIRGAQFSSIKNVDTSLEQYGFADFCDDYSDIKELEFGKYLCFCFRIDKKKLSASLLKKQFTLTLQKEMETIVTQGRTFISKERKIDIKEQVRLNLLASLLAETIEIPVVWDTEQKLLYFFSSNQKDLNSFKAYLFKTMDIGLDYVYKENTDIGYPFNVFLWYLSTRNNNFYINDHIKIQNQTEQITSKKENACQDLATRIINEDFTVNELSFTFGFGDDAFVYTAKSDINQLSLCMPKFKKELGDSDYTIFLVKIDQIKQFMDFFVQMYDSYTKADDKEIDEFLAELSE